MDRLGEAVAETVARHPEMVRRWVENQPGAWGFLASQGILAYRDKLGRRLTEDERRSLWSALWAALEATRDHLAR